jgi:hypothetical protein
MKRRQFLCAAAALALARSVPAAPVDWIARYQAAYRNENQGPTGICDHTSANIAMQAVALNIQGSASPLLSAGFGYLVDTGDTTFTVGSWASKAARSRETTGVCTDALYSQDDLLAHWQNGFPYPAQYLPQPACYADAPNHKLTQWSYLAIGSQFGNAPNMATIRQLLLAGYPITFAMGRHAACLMQVDADGYWHYGFDSLLAGVNVYGLGVGVRPWSATAIYEQGWDFCAYQAVSNAGGVQCHSN